MHQISHAERVIFIDLGEPDTSNCVRVSNTLPVGGIAGVPSEALSMVKINPRDGQANCGLGVHLIRC